MAEAAGLKPLGAERRSVGLLLLPTLAGLVFGAAGSILATTILSLFDWDLIGPPHFVGIDNYLTLAADRLFVNALLNTTLFAALYVPLTIVLSFALALLLNRHMRGRALFRAIYFLPVVSSPTAVGLLWTWIYAQDQGVLNTLLRAVGLSPVFWLGPGALLYSVVIVNVWGAIGEGMIIFLAGLQAVPKELYDAGRVEGANAWQRLTMITLPAMAPSLLFQAVLATIHAFQAFDYVYILTRLGNGNSSFPTLVFSIYRTGFKFFRMGDAAAQAVVLTLLILVLTAFYFRIQRRFAEVA